MPTTKKRINISVSKEVNETLQRLARRDQMPQATKAEHLLTMALEFEEDEVLNSIASRRDRKNSTFVPHTAAWQ